MRSNILAHPINPCEQAIFIVKKRDRGMSLPGPGFESVDPWPRLAFASAYLPRGCPSSGKTSRNRRWRARACFPPYTPDRGSACTFLRGSKSNRWEDPWHGSSGPHSTPENGARCREISAAAHCRWEEGIARRETHRRKEKCSRRCDPRCTENHP